MSAPSASRRLVAVIRRHPVAGFLAWSFPVGQAIAFQPVLARQWYGTDLPTAPFVVAANLVGLLLPALVITRIVDGRAGVRALWRRATRVRVPLRWYGLALVVVPSVTTATTAALLGTPEGTVRVLASALASGLLVQLALGFLTTNWAEEVAWTGFLQTRLQDRHGPVRAAVATGPLFALQHAALAAGNGWLGGVVVLLFITAMAVPFRFLQGWVANRTGSLLVVGLVHAAGNAMTDGSGFGGPGFLPRLYLDEAVGPVHLLASAALGVVVLAATRGRLGARRRTEPPSSPLLDRPQPRRCRCRCRCRCPGPAPSRPAGGHPSAERPSTSPRRTDTSTPAAGEEASSSPSPATSRRRATRPSRRGGEQDRDPGARAGTRRTSAASSIRAGAPP